MKYILFLALIVANNLGLSQVDSAVFFRLKQHVAILAADSMKGRSTGSDEEKMANSYLCASFFHQNNTRLKTLRFTINDSLSSEMVTCFVDQKAKKTILIGAHIDHIGMGGVLSKSPGNFSVHNGADDNASGVALLIELQRFLSSQKLPFNVLLVAYTGHEIGTFGSAHLSQHWRKKWKQLATVVNLDMVGRMDPVRPVIYVSNNLAADSLFRTTQDITVIQQDSKRVETLDTKHFLSANVPCITLTTGIHNDYHRVSDDAKYINYPGLYALQKFLEDQLTNPIVQERMLTAPTTKKD